MTWTVFVEGGGTSKDLRTRCREGFTQFLERLNLTEGRPKIVACGTRADAFKRLCIALNGDATESYLLLVDSEAVVSADAVWNHVREREGDNWPRPGNARDEHLHFMAVCMESWLVADVESLGKFYGKNFRSNRLPKKTAALESVDKDTILSALRSATRDTAKGEYSKGKISFAALGAIDVFVVGQRMSFCKRFVQQLEKTAKL